MSGVAVILVDGNYSVRRRTHPATRDADGLPVLPNPGTAEGPWPGAARETSFNSWSLRLDPRVWPLREGDLVSSGAQTWVIEGRPSLFTNAANSAVDYVSATGTLRPEELI